MEGGIERKREEWTEKGKWLFSTCALIEQYPMLDSTFQSIYCMRHAIGLEMSAQSLTPTSTQSLTALQACDTEPKSHTVHAMVGPSLQS